MPGCGPLPSAGIQPPAKSLPLVAQAMPRTTDLFPVQQGYGWDYQVTVAPVMDPDAEDHGSYSLQIDKVKVGPAGSELELRGLSGFSNRYSFPTLVQRPQGVQLQDMTFVGLGADEVPGLKLELFQLPLEVGRRWEDENIIGKVLSFETVNVPAGSFKAWRIEVIGTYDREYTIVGDYWIVPGVGIVKARYTVPGFHV
ncbi:MAG: hypothetical protein CVV27_06245, partial [Candidatus Melainabacteria bacterium HGW-Melainabacteria-1]